MSAYHKHMVKITQKKKIQTKLNKRKIFLIVASLLTILLGVFVSVKIYEKNKVLEGKKDVLDKSFTALQNLYDEFSDKAPESKEKILPVRGRCTSAGKYSTLYTCGPEAALAVNEINENEYVRLNDIAIDIYKGSSYFEGAESVPPYNNGLDPGLTSIAGSRFGDSDLECHYTSNYVQEKKTATFAWGCKLKINDKYYPTGY